MGEGEVRGGGEKRVARDVVLGGISTMSCQEERGCGEGGWQEMWFWACATQNK